MGFTKLDERILQSSIMAETPATFKIWIALLAACRPSGIAYVSAIYLSSVCHLPIARVEEALGRLSSPDKHSRTLDDDGRRIRRVNGGYEIINYALYREQSIQEIERERKRKQRGCDDVLDSPGPSGTVPGPSASASSSVFSSLQNKTKRGDKRGSVSPRIILNDSCRFEGITDEFAARMKEAYPAVDFVATIKAIEAYALANPTWRKSNWARAINSWFKKEQDRFPGRNRPSGKPDHDPEEWARRKEAELRAKGEL